MSDQQTIPGTIPASGAPAEETAEEKAVREAAAAAVAAAAAAPKPVKPAAPLPARGSNVAPPKRRDIVIPEAEFKKRVQREAAKEVQKALGCTLEEAIEKVKAAGAPAAAAPAVGAAPAAAVAPRAADPAAAREQERLRRVNADLERRLEAQRKKVVKVKTRARDRLLETELRYSAVAAGIKPDDADYAMGLYRAKLLQTSAGEEPIDPGVFWPTLREAKAYLFTDGVHAREVPVRPTTAPPASRKPGEVLPPQRAAGSPPSEKSVSDMDADEFGARTSSRYGFRPPQSA